LTDSKYYKDDLVMNAFFKSVIYLVETFYRTSVTTNVLRDEDVTLIIGSDNRNPNNRIDKLNMDPLEVVIQNLQKAIVSVKNDSLKACMNVQLGLVKFSSVYLDTDAAKTLFTPPAEEGKKSGKNKKKKPDLRSAD